MKLIKKITYVMFLFAAVAFTACSSDDDAAANNNENGNGNGNGDGNASEFLTAKIDGADFEAAQDPAVIVAASIGNGVLSIQGGQNDGQTIRATINGYDGPGTYTTGDGLNNTNQLMYVTLTPVATWMSTFNIGSGTLEVTSDDGDVIEGTFSFEGFNAEDNTTKNITEGAFKAVIE